MTFEYFSIYVKTNFCLFSKLLAFLSGPALHTLSKLYDVPVGVVTPSILRLCIALFAVAEGWLLLDIG